MAAKVISAIVTLIILLIVAAVMFLFMLVAMNGFSEADASYGLIAYVVLVAILSLLMSGASVLSVHKLIKREFNAVGAVAICSIIFSILGTGAIAISAFIGIGVAEFVRVNF